ncbi:hypothetical protein CRUP_010888 [Coryphaenoides rupestris]|nr:hypothetical protein CRUP_010888 [Coryphaenoides rupestris]
MQPMGPEGPGVLRVLGPRVLWSWILGPGVLRVLGPEGPVCDIIQVAAISGQRSFNVYTLPPSPITAQAAGITGFVVRDGTLYVHGTAVHTVSLAEALRSFMVFLRSVPQPVVLAAHSGMRFDVPVLRRALLLTSLRDEFARLNASFLDTFLLAKRLYPNQASFSQVNLVKHFLKKNYDAHNALGDVQALQELYCRWNPDSGHVKRCTF